MMDIYAHHKDGSPLSVQQETLEGLLKLCEVMDLLLLTSKQGETFPSPALGLLRKAEKRLSSLRSDLQELGSCWDLPA